MTQMPGAAKRALHQPSFAEDCAAHARAKGQQYGVFGALGGALPDLAQQSCVSIVEHRHFAFEKSTPIKPFDAVHLAGLVGDRATVF